MVDGLMTEYLVQCDETYRRMVLHPAAARREQSARELRGHDHPPRNRSWRHGISGWVGDWLVRLVRLGQRVQAEPPPTALPRT